MAEKYINKSISEKLSVLRTLVNSNPQQVVKQALALAVKVKTSTDVELKAEAFHVVGRCFDELRQFDESLLWYSQALELWKLSRNKLGTAKTINNMGLAYYDTSRFKEAITFLLQAADLKLELKEYQSLTGTYINLGNAYEKLSEHKKAIEVYYKSLKISEGLGDNLRTAVGYQNMGIIYHVRGDDRRALELYQKARQLVTGTEHKVMQLDLDNNIGGALQHLKQYREALQYFEQSLQMAKAIKHVPVIIAATNNIGVNLKLLGRLNEALVASKKGLELAIEENDFLNQCNALINIGEVYLKSKSYDAARSYLNQALSLAQKAGFKHNEVEIYLQLSKLFEAMKKPTVALQYYKQHDKVKSAVNKAEIANRINQLQTQYEVAKKEEELLKARSLQTESELKALRAQMDPHFIFNSLSSMRKELLEGNIDKADQYIVRFSRLLRLILDTTRTPQVKLSDNIELLHLYIQIEQSRQANSFTYHINVAKVIKPENIYVPGMVLQPLIENAIVHGLFHKQKGEGKLSVNISKLGNALKIKVSDNGVGRNNSAVTRSSKHRSHATSIIRETLELAWKNKMKDRFFVIKDKIDAQGEPAGTEVIVLLPFAHY